MTGTRDEHIDEGVLPLPSDDRRREKGIPRERFERVYSPIGLDIGSETPAEIAVSIMAEIVKVRRGGTGLTLSDERRQGKKKR